MKCPVCGFEAGEGVKFCPKCGASLESTFIMATTHVVPGYRIKKVLGIVTGLSPRTRGVLGRFIAGIETMIGGEVTAFTSEMEKAKALALGANAVIGIDIETSDLGLGAGIVLVSATGTAVILEPEQ